jgi:hypothetical protein
VGRIVSQVTIQQKWPRFRLEAVAPDPFRQQFIEKPATNLYQNSAKKSLFCRYLAIPAGDI